MDDDELIDLGKLMGERRIVPPTDGDPLLGFSESLTAETRRLEAVHRQAAASALRTTLKRQEEGRNHAIGQQPAPSPATNQGTPPTPGGVTEGLLLAFAQALNKLADAVATLAYQMAQKQEPRRPSSFRIEKDLEGNKRVVPEYDGGEEML